MSWISEDLKKQIADKARELIELVEKTKIVKEHWFMLRKIVIDVKWHKDSLQEIESIWDGAGLKVGHTIFKGDGLSWG